MQPPQVESQFPRVRSHALGSETYERGTKRYGSITIIPVCSGISQTGASSEEKLDCTSIACPLTCCLYVREPDFVPYTCPFWGVSYICLSLCSGLSTLLSHRHPCVDSPPTEQSATWARFMHSTVGVRLLPVTSIAQRSTGRG